MKVFIVFGVGSSGSKEVVTVARLLFYESLTISLQGRNGNVMCKRSRNGRTYESRCVVNLPSSEKKFFNLWCSHLKKILNDEGNKLYTITAEELDTLMARSLRVKGPTNSQKCNSSSPALPLHVDTPHHSALISNSGVLNAESGTGPNVFGITNDSPSSSTQLFERRTIAGAVVGVVGLLMLASLVVKKAYRYVTSSVPGQLSDARLSSLDDSNQIQTSECGV